MPRMHETEQSLIGKFNEAVGLTQDKQGSEGCYMELFRFIRSRAQLWTRYSFMFPVGSYEKAMGELHNILSELPPCQSPEVLEGVIRRIDTISETLTMSGQDLSKQPLQRAS